VEVINTYSLRKQYGNMFALKDISLNVKPGEIYGFLGLNGAGKTTLIRMLLGMIKPDSGQIRLFGKELDFKFNQWNDIGYLVETPYSYPNLSVIDNLKVYYTLRKLKQPQLINEVIEKLKLSTYKTKLAKDLSLGNQQRLGIAKALIHKPKLLILDEPINGLDPEGIVEVRNLLCELAYQGSTVFLSSHLLGEISMIANEIGIIHNGRLIKELSTKELNQQLRRKLVINTCDNSKASEYLADIGFKIFPNNQKELEIQDGRAIEKPESITSFLCEKGLPPKQIYEFTENLEMYFLRTINKEK
jgi:ABC-2 type transport system ATP-binding protein